VRSLDGQRKKTDAASEPCRLHIPYAYGRVAGPGAATGNLAAAAVFLQYPLPTCTCFSDKLSNSYAGFTLDLSTKFISPNQAIVWKACHIVISAHGDRLWRTQVFFWTNFAIAELHEILDLKQETRSSQVSNFKHNSWKPKFKF
jgi:hypothetical protein